MFMICHVTIFCKEKKKQDLLMQHSHFSCIFPKCNGINSESREMIRLLLQSPTQARVWLTEILMTKYYKSCYCLIRYYAVHQKHGATFE